ncbi:unnamed protein product [Ectocarpus fasciculatus]
MILLWLQKFSSIVFLRQPVQIGYFQPTVVVIFISHHPKTTYIPRIGDYGRYKSLDPCRGGPTSVFLSHMVVNQGTPPIAGQPVPVGVCRRQGRDFPVLVTGGAHLMTKGHWRCSGAAALALVGHHSGFEFINVEVRFAAVHLLALSNPSAYPVADHFAPTLFPRDRRISSFALVTSLPLYSLFVMPTVFAISFPVLSLG